MSNNIILDKTYNFAVLMVKLSQKLISEKKEYVLSKQILRSGTSVGANTEEARETKYWLRILKDTGYISENEFQKYFIDIEEILKILYAIINSSRINL
ncbi:four helix bundle protein [Mariniflexile sp. HMF6888]|uniref:four helix bundle protein n=1 Tax=Mariniflexile sp. HMF6888 TaxID=3373086 RepID=UPI0037A28D5F